MFELFDTPEISIDRLADLHPSHYILCDIRDEVSHLYGCIPNSVSMPDIVEQAKAGTLDKSASYVLYCTKGVNSEEAVEQLCRDIEKLTGR